MRINEVKDKEVNVTLSSDDLISISNFIYFYERYHAKVEDECAMGLRPDEHALAKQVITARDLCQYGNLDSHALIHIVKHEMASNPESRLVKYIKAIGVPGQTGADSE